MRNDMHKLLCETPRVGSSWKNGEVRNQRRRHRDGDEDLPRHSPMKPRGWRYGDRKQRNENLALLVRFLESRIGRNWDTVYAEICEHFGKNSAIHFRIFQHLHRYVHGSGGEEYTHDGRYADFVLDKQTRLQRNKDRRSYRKTWKDEDRIWVNDKILLMRDEDKIWHFLSMKKVSTIPRSEWRMEEFSYEFNGTIQTYSKRVLHAPKVTDAWTKKEIARDSRTSWSNPYRRGGVYCVRTRQLSKNDLRKYGLSNG